MNRHDALQKNRRPSPTSCFPDELHLRRTNPELHLPLDLCAMIAGLITGQVIASDIKLHFFLNGKFSAKQDLHGIAVDLRSIDRKLSAFFRIRTSDQDGFFSDCLTRST